MKIELFSVKGQAFLFIVKIVTCKYTNYFSTFLLYTDSQKKATGSQFFLCKIQI